MLYKLRTPLKIIEWLVALLIAIVAAFIQADPQKWGEPFSVHIKFAVDWSIPLMVSLAFTIFVLKLIREAIDHYTANKDDIKKTLDALQKAFFQAVAAEDLYKNRATLFKVRVNPFTRNQYLKIYARSGTSHQKVKVRFPINDEEIKKNEGVAGRAYFQDGTVSVKNLPEWPNQASPTNPACKKYCREGYVSWETAMRLDVHSRSIAAVVVRKAGKRWGVLVLDSQDPLGASLSNDKMAMMNLIGQVLTSHV